MAEIKSTLDLVMERTRHMGQSEEEKSAQKLEGFLKNLNGLVQRYEDGHLRQREIEREIRRVQENHGISDGQVLLDGLLERLDLERENRPVLDLLRTICGVAVGPIEEVLQQYRDAILEAKQRQDDIARDALSSGHGISGSAVVAFPQASPGWQEKAAAIKREFDQRLGGALRAAES